MVAIVTQRLQGFGATNRVAQFIAAANHRFMTWRHNHAAEIALNKLSDRELEDIGYCRGDLANMFR